MHPKLREYFNSTLEDFKSDPRCKGAFMSGSALDVNEDIYSDVDPFFVIADDGFLSFEKDMQQIFAKYADEIVMYWRENALDGLHNYAVMLKAPHLMQYDVNIIKESALTPGHLINIQPEMVLFDKTGLLKEYISEKPEINYNPQKLLHTISRYWIYAFIITKYIKRNDIFKMLYVEQTEFFHCHMEILHALMPDKYWDWYPININKYLSREQKDYMLLYLQTTDRDDILKVLLNQLNNFSCDAKSACKNFNLDYPQNFENQVMDYIKVNLY